ncbi:MAG: hypothetical protein R3345_03515 [Fulvivirga sp.]|nr:hypothetical protein [Fulvivirga sp.]
MKKIRQLYQQYQAYIKVDLVMYGVMILLIIAYTLYAFISS